MSFLAAVLLASGLSTAILVTVGLAASVGSWDVRFCGSWFEAAGLVVGVFGGSGFRGFGFGSIKFGSC